MSYATGSGDYVALMAAVLSFALADGWTELGGGGSGFPIASPGGTVAAFDWNSETFAASDFTNGAAGGPFTARWLKWGIGANGAAATAMAATTMGTIDDNPIEEQNRYPVSPNASFTYSEWHIFSDPASGADYIHVAARFPNSANPDQWMHMSVGEVDRQGMSYTGIAYCAGLKRCGWANSAATTANWNTNSTTAWPFAGGWRGADTSDDGWSNTVTIIGGTSPVNDAAGYPSVGQVNLGGDALWSATRPGRDSDNGPPRYSEGGNGYNLAYYAMASQPMPFTGALSLTAMPLVYLTANSAGARGTFCGVFPGVRLANLQDFNPGDQVTFGSETWMVFPALRKTDDVFLGDSGVVTSARTGLAYKRVA